MSWLIAGFAPSGDLAPAKRGFSIAESELTLSANALSTTHILSVWYRDAGASPTSAAAAATFALSQTGAAIIEYEASNIDATGGILNAIVQCPTGTGTGTTGTVTFSARSRTTNTQLTFWCHLADEVTTPMSGWTETSGADASFASPATGVEAEFRQDGTFNTSCTATWTTSSAWRGVGLELRGLAPVTGTGTLAAAKPSVAATAIHRGLTMVTITGSIYDAATGNKRTAGQLVIQPKTFIADGRNFVTPAVIRVTIPGSGDLSFSLAASNGVPYVVEFDPAPSDTTTPLRLKSGYFRNLWLVPSPGPVGIHQL